MELSRSARQASPMDSDGTHVPTPQGTLEVTPQVVRLRRGPPFGRRTVTEIPRHAILIARLGSRFHTLPLVIGGLFLAGALAATALVTTTTGPTLATDHLLRSLALVLVIAGALLLLSLPLSWRAVLEVRSGQDTIRVETGFRRRERLAQALNCLQSQPDPQHTGPVHNAVNTPSGRPARSP